jgi:LPS-assembly lipoprotein
MRLIVTRLCVLVLLAAAINGCGWHLRGQVPLTGLETLTIQGGGELRHELITQLERNGVLVHGHSPWQLSLDDMQWRRRTVAVDERGRATVISLRFQVTWILQHRDDDKRLARDRLSLSRSFDYQPGAATSSSDEEELLREAIYRDAAGQLIRQLNATIERWSQQDASDAAES